MKLTAKEIRQVVRKLDEEINHYVDYDDLFQGGCCYAAYVLAENLKRLGIKYNVVIYQCYKVLNLTRFREVIKGEGIAHVGIQVEVGGKKKIIGSCEDVENWIRRHKMDCTIRTYRRISPMTLLRGYNKNNYWCRRYQTSNNSQLMEDISEIANEYIKTTVI